MFLFKLSGVFCWFSGCLWLDVVARGGWLGGWCFGWVELVLESLLGFVELFTWFVGLLC